MPQRDPTEAIRYGGTATLRSSFGQSATAHPDHIDQLIAIGTVNKITK
jgi:hypothetical protein